MTVVQDQSLFTRLVSQIQDATDEKELHWFEKKVVIPEFPQIIETLTVCSNLLLYNSPQHPDPQNRIERGPPIKLAVSSSKSERLKGIVVRDGAYITEFHVTIKDHYFNKYFNKLNLVKPVLLNQIINTKVAIDDSISLMESLPNLDKQQQQQQQQQHQHQKVFEEDHETYHKNLIDSFQSLLSNIQTAKTNLQLPTDPQLVFPLKVTLPDFFHPELPPTITIDYYISQAEICIDLKSLHRITEKPWCEVDSKTGKSYVDNVRDDMKLPSANSSVSSLTQASLEKSPALPRVENNNFLSSMMSHIQLKPKHDSMDYITRCITYNNMVVMINTKLEVSSEDPVLVSCFTKLDTIECIIRNFLKSLKNLLH
ncbi:RAV2 [Candida oxycetoniae]|uniref:RAV2 n=1 Tax=Candida oxycetoniae TaxID=497107 RepID=A0AAI9WWM2_9ASCO|nr:RAV2 [Candida oxycetoniae]KAI3403083.2 RAV2 [Candida oxycetoniae]